MERTPLDSIVAPDDGGPGVAADRSVGSARPDMPDPDAHRRPITVRSDAALLALARDHGVTGDGTEEDPVLLDGHSLKETGADSLVLQNTSFHLVVQGLILEGDGHGTALVLRNAENVTLLGVRLSDHHTGIRLEGARDVTVRGSTFDSNQQAIRIEGAKDVDIMRNRFEGNVHAVYTKPPEPEAEGTGEKTVRIRLVANTFTRERLLVEDAEPDSAAGSGVILSGRDHHVAQNVFSGHAPAGLRIEAQDVTVVKNEFVEENDHGIITSDSRNILVEGNRFDRNLLSAVASFRVQDLHLIGNTLTNNPGGGLQSVDDHELRVESNEFSWSRWAVKAWSSKGAIVQGNSFTGGTHGVWLLDAEHASVQDNGFTRVWEGGVVLSGGKMISVTGNLVWKAKTHGILLFDSRDVTVEGNSITNTTQGIVVDGGSADVDVGHNDVMGKGSVGIRVLASRGVHVHDNRASGLDFGVQVGTDAQQTTLRQIHASANYAGVLIEAQEPGALIEDMEATGNTIGVMVRAGTGTVQESLLTGNEIAVFLLDAQDATVTRSHVQNNKIGFYFIKSSGNLVYDNVIGDQGTDQNVLLFNSPNNHWFVTPREGPNILGGPWIAGNWWDDYIGDDVDDDGLGDVPHQPIPYHPALEVPVYTLGAPMGPFDLRPLVGEDDV